MTTKHILLLAALALTPLAAIAQSPAPPTPTRPASPPPPRDHEPKVPVTFLGVVTSEIPSVLCDQLGIPRGFGLVADYVEADGPAAAAGVQQNDILKMFNDQILTDPSQLAKLVRSNKEGTTVSITLLRKGKEQKVSVKLGTKEVPKRQLEGGRMGGPGWHMPMHMGDPNLGDLGQEFREQMEELKQQMGDRDHGMIHDAVARAHQEAQRAQEEVRRAAQQLRTLSYNNNGALQRTTIDLKNAQIVVSDDKGELRIETVDGRKMLTAKDPQGKLIFSGPIETKEEIAKVPPAVWQRYDKLQQRDLPAFAPRGPRLDAPDEADGEAGMDDDSPAAAQSSNIL